MSIEDLLRPRYKMIADYPGNNRPIGFVFTMDKKDSEGWYTTTGYLQEKFFAMYPHLFQPLQWWEERKPEDMPEYVRCIKTPDQIIMPGEILKVVWNNNGGKVDNGPWVFPYTNCYIPATAEEYTQYITNKNA